MTAFDKWCEENNIQFKEYVEKRAGGYPDPLDLPPGYYDELWFEFGATVEKLVKAIAACLTIDRPGATIEVVPKKGGKV